MNILLPDGSGMTVDDGATAADVAAAIGPRLAKAALAARVGTGWSTWVRPWMRATR